MNLNAITEDDVRRATALYDEIGREEFLHRYGFRASRTYELEVSGRTYPSKAILGVAHEFATGAALTSSDFTGGRGQTVKILERLGFAIIAEGGADPATSAFMLLWNPQRYDWPDDLRLDILSGTMDGISVMERWSVYANSTKIKVGDRVYLRKTGVPPRGIVASGTVTGEPVPDRHWSEDSRKAAIYVDVEWDAMVEPEDVLDLSGIAEQFPSATWTAPGGGARVPDEARESLELAWDQHVDRVLASYGESNANQPTHKQEIEVRHGLALVRTRRHQRAFRALLLSELEHECEYPPCGITALEVLEAAHIVPDSEGGEATLENGLLLCRNHHRALDSGLMSYAENDRFVWADGVEPF